jgi:NDP-sugar pyrophosphorylase family protein
MGSSDRPQAPRAGARADTRLNIVVPMAGAGSRFAVRGYRDPKPLIPVLGVPMIRRVIENLRPSQPHRFVFVCQRAHLAAYALEPRLRAWAPGCEIVALDGLTQGAACTVLAARALIDDGQPLMIANSDQYVETDLDAYLAQLPARDLDGLIMTMTASDPKWSYAQLDADGRVRRVVEKQVVSDEATVGIYNFRAGRMFVAAADEMIARDERVNGEFYVAPAYDAMVRAGLRVGVHNIGHEGRGMHGLGTPEDLERFLERPPADLPEALA